MSDQDDKVVPLRIVKNNPDSDPDGSTLEGLFQHILERTAELKSVEGRNVRKAIVVLLDDSDERYWVMSSSLDMKRSEIVALMTYVANQEIRRITDG